MTRFLIALLLLFSSKLTFAVQLSGDGRGQVMIFPFFTTQNGWDSLINVSLAPVGSGVLKVRVLDAVDGGVTDSFNVYASPGENWRAALLELPGGETVMHIEEGACIVSDDGSSGGAGTDFPISVKTGMIEVYRINARVPTTTASTLTCEEMAQRWEPGGTWTDDALEGLEEIHEEFQNQGYGYFELVNVAEGLSIEEPATGLVNVVESFEHTAPADLTPSLANADPLAILRDGSHVEPDSGEGIDAVALVLSTTYGTILNDVVLDADVAAATDWIISFPLRGYRSYGFFNVDFGGIVKVCNENQFATGASGPTIQRTLRDPWASWGGGNSYNDQLVDLDPTPPGFYTPFLCNAVNLISFGTTQGIFLSEESPLQTAAGLPGTDPVLDSGNMTVSYTFSDGLSLSPGDNAGRPLLAFRATTVKNGALDGGSTLANYMFLKPHIIR